MQVGTAQDMRSREGMTAALLTAPALATIVLLFVVPIGYVLVLSVTEPRISLDHFRRIFTVPFYTDVMINTFRTSLIVTIACLAARLSARLRHRAPQRRHLADLILLVA